MKKIISVFVACLLLVGCVCTLASCGKAISGEYEADLLLAEVSYNFKSSGKVTVTIDLPVVEDVVVEGTYSFNKDGTEITITLDSENEDAEKYAGTMSYSEGVEDGEKYIKLDGVKYEKVD